MLGNKCRVHSLVLAGRANKFSVLDDNTYTNKTWAEVSGISVTEIHVMEVEFLSNMRYSLLASAADWEDWQMKLRTYYTFCETAAKPVYLQTSPHHGGIPSPISTQSSPPILNLSCPSSSTLGPGFLNGHHWSSSNSSTPTVVASPLPPLPRFEQNLYSRKRSYDEEAEEPVAKRVTRSMGPAPLYNPSVPRLRLEAPRLPNLTISTSQPVIHNYNGANVPLLPPLTGRSMATVFPTTPTNWPPQLPMLTPTGPRNASGHNTPSRHESPHSHSVQDLLAYGSSPITANFPSQGQNSPLDYCQNRSSPYKPVRHVNTLLYPPSQSTMRDYPISANQMHYQPLGAKRNDYRSGIVPDYASQHSHYQTLPVLPQPDFRS
jgi:hypothetical protein